jgi:GNAT superfamily N-acetyltransferase
MTGRVFIEPLRVEQLDELAGVLLQPAVYEHIEDGLPTINDFKLSLSRALAGPPDQAAGQTWLNYLVRHADTNVMLGRLEATAHDSLAEVAFLFDPSHWGKGYATEGLLWLHAEVRRTCNVSTFWATTVPANFKCQALLLRCGYVQVIGSIPHLLSYAPGDLVFRYESAA